MISLASSGPGMLPVSRNEGSAHLRSGRSKLLWIALSASAVMAVVEACKQSIFPAITIWQSHSMTIVLTGLAAVVAGWVVRRRENKLADRVVRELIAEVNQGRSQNQLLVDEKRLMDASFALLFQHNPLPMILLDLQSLGILAVNEAAVKHYGYTQEEFGRVGMKEIRPNDDWPALQAEMKTIEVSGQYRSEERRVGKEW